jgi:hypothetical protein
MLQIEFKNYFKQNKFFEIKIIKTFLCSKNFFKVPKKSKK